MNGIIIVNKDLGYTSRDIVNLVSKALNTRKVGHNGTLDPNASGVLVLCVGKALKMCELMANDDKDYVAEVILGIETDTGDMDKNATIINEQIVNFSEEEIINIVNSFIGVYEQEVPKYSAVKVNGKKLYEYARTNTQINLPSRKVEIKQIKVINKIENVDGKIYFKIACTVSKGTYIRSLIRDIGKKLGCGATMNSLIRTRQGIFDIDNSYTIDDIQNGKYKIIPIVDAFPNIKVISVNDELAFKIRNGMILDNLFEDDLVFISDKDHNLLALYKNELGKCKVYKMLI